MALSMTVQFGENVKEPKSIEVFFEPAGEIVISEYGFACKALSGQSRYMFLLVAEERTGWNMLKHNFECT